MSDATPRLLRAAFLFLSCMIMQACTPDEGRGGYAQIAGVVMVRDWNSSFTLIQDTFPAMDERIYLIYGDEGVPGTDQRTSFDGRYRFDQLHPGHYTVYAYSDRKPTPDNTSSTEPVVLKVHLTDKRAQHQADTLWINR
jgi:hypothetical protein